MIPKYTFRDLINPNYESQLIEEIKGLGNELFQDPNSSQQSFNLSLSDNNSIKHQQHFNFSGDPLPTKRKPVSYHENVYPSNERKLSNKKATIFEMKNPSSLSKTVKNRIINSQYQVSKSNKKGKSKESVSSSIEKNVYGRLKTEVKYRNKCPKRTYDQNQSKWRQFLDKEKAWKDAKNYAQNSRILQQKHPKNSVEGYISQLKTQTSRLKKTFESYGERESNLEGREKGKFSNYHFTVGESEREQLRRMKYNFH